MRKPLNKAPARLQRMMLTLQRYQFTVTYKKGTSLYLADTLSRAALDTKVDVNVTGFEVFTLDLEQMVIQNPRLTRESECSLRKETANDPALSHLYTLITSGWPESKFCLPEAVQVFWNFRDELSIHDGLVYKSEAVLVPDAMLPEMMKKIHINHFGSESTIRMVCFGQG